MLSNHIICHRNKFTGLAFCAFHLRLSADPRTPFVFTGGLISGTPAPPTLEPNREHIGSPGKQIAKQMNFVCLWRMNVYLRRIGAFFGSNLVLNLPNLRNQFSPPPIQFGQLITQHSQLFLPLGHKSHPTQPTDNIAEKLFPSCGGQNRHDNRPKIFTISLRLKSVNIANYHCLSKGPKMQAHSFQAIKKGLTLLSAPVKSGAGEGNRTLTTSLEG